MYSPVEIYNGEIAQDDNNKSLKQFKNYCGKKFFFSILTITTFSEVVYEMFHVLSCGFEIK